MKALLLLPTVTDRFRANPGRPRMNVPLRVGYLAAAARQHGHDVVVLDCLAAGWRTSQRDGDLTRLGLRDDEIEARIRQIAPDIVGISCMFTGFDGDTRRIAAVAKKALPKVPVVVGGAEASARPAAFADHPNIDLVVRSEGEQVFVDLLAHLEREGVLPDDLAGTAVKGQINPLAELIPDVDTIPFPARDLLPMDVYLEDQHVVEPYAKRRPVGYICSSRGCPYNCLFCSTRKLWRKWRPRSPKNIVDEIQVLIDTYHIREINFVDDSFLVDRGRVLDLCNEIKRRNIDISWNVASGITIWRATEEVLHAMVETGYYRAGFPIESGDPAMLKYIRKPIDLDHVGEIIDFCHKLGLWTSGFFIIGFPEQTAESIEKTCLFAENCGLDMISVYILQPYAGSDVYTIMGELGLLNNPDAAASTIFHTTYCSKYFSADELNAKREEMVVRFTKKRLKRLLTPKGLADLRRKMNTPERFLYGTRVFGTFAMNSLRSRKISELGPSVPT